MSRRSNSLFTRRLGLFLAALGVLAGFGDAWPPGDSWAAQAGGAGASPSQVLSLPAKSPGPARCPALLMESGSTILKALPVLSLTDTDHSPVSLSISLPDRSPTGAAREASVASEASVLNRIRLQAHAPPATL